MVLAILHLHLLRPDCFLPRHLLETMKRPTEKEKYQHQRKRLSSDLVEGSRVT